MLWVALHLPQLPLDVFLRGSPMQQPFAIAQDHQVLSCDRKAAARGIRPGMSISAALALAPQTHIKTRDGAAETEALLGLAAWALQFTPSVVPEFPDTLALEVSGSLKLLGGLSLLLSRLQQGITGMGYQLRLAYAPTLRAACWMARAGAKSSSSEPSQDLPQMVAELPISVLPEQTRQLLDNIGARRIADVLALPREGLARRFGQDLLDDIDRALGRLPEARTFFQPPETFYASIELPAEVSQSEALLFASRRLFIQLEGFLAARHAGVQQLALRLTHRNAFTELAIGMLAPGRDASHFTLLLREQLARLALRQPVRALSLRADEVLPLADHNLGLFPEDGAAAAQSWQQLIERLKARLGAASIQSPAMAADHRPEQAGLLGETPSQMQLDFGERPFWLLPAPRRLGSAPDYQGPLELLAGPERIESGWWDGDEAMRDYFIARSARRELLWVYRERRPAHIGLWYLHGIFA